MARCWYALHCNSRKEDLVAHQLVVHELDIYYPTIKVNPVNPRARKIQPYFPGYLFVRVDLETFGMAPLSLPTLRHQYRLVRWCARARTSRAPRRYR